MESGLRGDSLIWLMIRPFAMMQMMHLPLRSRTT